MFPFIQGVKLTISKQRWRISRNASPFRRYPYCRNREYHPNKHLRYPPPDSSDSTIHDHSISRFRPPVPDPQHGFFNWSNPFFPPCYILHVKRWSCDLDQSTSGRSKGFKSSCANGTTCFRCTLCLPPPTPSVIPLAKFIDYQYE